MTCAQSVYELKRSVWLQVCEYFFRKSESKDPQGIRIFCRFVITRYVNVMIAWWRNFLFPGEGLAARPILGNRLRGAVPTPPVENWQELLLGTALYGIITIIVWIYLEDMPTFQLKKYITNKVMFQKIIKSARVLLLPTFHYHWRPGRRLGNNPLRHFEFIAEAFRK